MADKPGPGPTPSKEAAVAIISPTETGTGSPTLSQDEEAGTGSPTPSQAAAAETTSIVLLSNKTKSVISMPEEKEGFQNKLEYTLVLIGCAVGFGNIWRFPYLMQKHGGVVFLIPYFLSLALLGLPTFFLELAVGQRLRKGSVKAWVEISPYLSGVGVASGFACFILGFYYNTLLAWCFYYFFAGFATEMPWTTCELAAGLKCYTCSKAYNKSECDECDQIKPASHYWYNEVLQISDGIDDPGKFNFRMFICLMLAWLVTWGILVKGVKASGKVAYVTALLPYAVMITFLIKGLLLEGMGIGYKVAFTPKWEKLLDGEVWFAGGTQIFFSLSLGFGMMMSFSSLNPANNNCYRDAVTVALINCGTSIFAACVVFPTLGYKGTMQYNTCMKEIKKLAKENPTKFELNNTLVKESNVSLFYINEYADKKNKTKKIYKTCDLVNEVTKSAQGTGLIFIAYSEAIASFEAPYIWAFLFYLMVILLGIDSGFTTVEAAIVCVKDLGIFPKKFKKWVITSIVCGILFCPSFIFAFGWGEYMVTFLDEFTLNWTLLSVGFCQCIGVAWIYGLKQFAYDIQLMTGKKPNAYMMICWKFISPLVTLALFLVMLVQYFMKPLTYSTFRHGKGAIDRPAEPWPTLALTMGLVFLTFALGAIPVFAILAHFKIRPIKKDTGEDEFPEFELCAERRITGTESEASTTLKKVLYWGSSTEIRHTEDYRRKSIALPEPGIQDTATSPIVRGRGESPASSSDSDAKSQASAKLYKALV